MEQNQEYSKKVGYAATDPSSSSNNYGFQSRYSSQKQYLNPYLANNHYNKLQY